MDWTDALLIFVAVVAALNYRWILEILSVVFYVAYHACRATLLGVAAIPRVARGLPRFARDVYADIKREAEAAATPREES
jgi:hypothetical protein